MYEAYLTCSKRTGLHKVLRVVPATYLEEERPAGPFADAFNALATSNNALELLEAIDRLPLLVPAEKLGGERRVFTVDEAVAMLDGGKWAPSRPETLEYEAHFDAGAPDGGGNLKRATNAVLRRRDAQAAGLADLLRITDRESARVVAEPLLDWTFARNVLGLTARLLYQISSGNPGGALEQAGFTHDRSRPLKADVYRIPFAFNPFFTQGIAFFTDHAKLNPLMERALTAEKTKAGAVKRRFEEGVGVYVVTAPVATGEYSSIFQDRMGISEKRFYLCVEDHGEGQERLAAECVRAIASAAMGLEGDDGENLGWELDAQSLLDGSPAPRFSRRSMLPDFMYRLVYRSSRSEGIGICAHCGNAMLVSRGRGKPRLFCSDACRMRHKRSS